MLQLIRNIRSAGRTWVLALTALTIVLLIDVVGIILVIALLTLPAATAGCFTRHLWSMMILSSILSWVFVTAGLLCFNGYLHI